MQSVDEELANYPVWYLYLDGLTSIDKDVAQELAKFKKTVLYLDGMTSIDKDVLKILESNEYISLPSKYRFKKD